MLKCLNQGLGHCFQSLSSIFCAENAPYDFVVMLATVLPLGASSTNTEIRLTELPFENGESRSIRLLVCFSLGRVWYPLIPNDVHIVTAHHDRELKFRFLLRFARPRRKYNYHVAQESRSMSFT